MTLVEQLAASVMGSSYDNLSLAARDQLKIRILDSLGCAIAALNGESIRAPAHCCKTLRGLAPCALRRSAFNGWRRRNLWYGRESTALRATRTGMLSHWKELAYPNTAFGATHAAFLAGRGIIGPLEVFEGNKGFMDAIVGHFDIDWSKEGLERVTRTIVKKYNAEIQSQSAIEGTQELKPEHHVAGHDVERIDIEIFDVAHNIIGGGEEGDKTIVRTKE